MKFANSIAASLHFIHFHIDEAFELQLQAVGFQRAPRFVLLIINVIAPPFDMYLSKEVGWLHVASNDMQGEWLLHEIDVFPLAK